MASVLLERVRRGRVTQATEGLENFQVLRFSGPFAGFNSYRSPDTIPNGTGKNSGMQSPDLLNMHSRPFGSMTSFPGHANINSSAVNSSKSITGLHYDAEVSQRLVVVSQGKVFEHIDASTQTDRTDTATITDDDDNLVDFAMLNSLTILAFNKEDTVLKWSGAGNNVATLGGSPRSGVRYCADWDRRMWLGSDQNGDYSLKDNPESYDTTDDTLSFTGTNDGSVLTGMRKSGDSLYFGKGGPNAQKEHVFRAFRTGNPAVPYQFERLNTGGVGPISQQAFLDLPNGDLIFLSKDGSVYIIRGNQIVEIGLNIQNTIRDDYNASRFQFASMGILRELGLVGLSLSLSGSNTNDRTWWYDYLNSKPGNPDREYWYRGTHTINAWGERDASGQIQLVTGGYDGLFERQNSGDSYAGSAFTKRWKTPALLIGNVFQSYYIIGIVAVFKPTGNFNVTLNYFTDFSKSSTSAGTFSVVGGAALGKFVLGTDVLGGKDQGVAYITLGAVARRIELEFLNTSANEPFNINSLYFLVRPLYQGVDV